MKQQLLILGKLLLFFSVSEGRLAGLLFEGVGEIGLAFIAALLCDHGKGKGGGAQKLFGKGEAHLGQILPGREPHDLAEAGTEKITAQMCMLCQHIQMDVFPEMMVNIFFGRYDSGKMRVNFLGRGRLMAQQGSSLGKQGA